jgi:hypothetical protein
MTKPMLQSDKSFQEMTDDELIATLIECQYGERTSVKSIVAEAVNEELDRRRYGGSVARSSEL